MRLRLSARLVDTPSRAQTSRYERPKVQEKPLVDPAILPKTLYDHLNEVLHLPPSLVSAYRTTLAAHGLDPLRKQRNPESPPVGGPSQEATNIHFSQAFDGSSARAALAITNPKNGWTRAANAFIESLSGNAVCLVDAPCGAGATSLTFLTSVAELRAQGVLPRLPLDVVLIGAELSAPARTYAAEMYFKLEPFLRQQAVFFRFDLMHWDVLDAVANRDVIRAAVRAFAVPCKRLLLVANFSDFLERNRKRKEAMPQLDALFLQLSGKDAIAVWIEPNTNLAGGLLASLASWAKTAWARFAAVVGASDDSSPVFRGDSLFQPAGLGDKLATVRMAILRFDLDS